MDTAFSPEELVPEAKQTIPEQQSPEQTKRSLLSALSDGIVQHTQSQLKSLSESLKDYLFWMQIVARLSTIIDSIPNGEESDDTSFGKMFGCISESILKFLSSSGSLNHERIMLALLWLHHEWYYRQFTRSNKRLESIFTYIISSFCDEVKCSLLADDNTYATSDDHLEHSILESQNIKDTVGVLLESRDANVLNLSYFLALSPIATATILQTSLYSILSSTPMGQDDPSHLDELFLLGREELSLRRLCYVLGVTCKLCKLRPKVRSFLMPVLLQFLIHKHRGYRHFSIHIILEKLLPSQDDGNEFFLMLLKDFSLNQLREVSLDSAVTEQYYGYGPDKRVKREANSFPLASSARSVIEAKSDIFFALCMRYPSLLTYFYDNWRIYFAEDAMEDDMEPKMDVQTGSDHPIHRKKVSSSLRQTILNIYNNSQNRMELVNDVLRVYHRGGEPFLSYLINSLSFDTDRQNISHRLDSTLVAAIMEVVQTHQLGTMFMVPLLGGLEKVPLGTYVVLFPTPFGFLLFIP